MSANIQYKDHQRKMQGKNAKEYIFLEAIPFVTSSLHILLRMYRKRLRWASFCVNNVGDLGELFRNPKKLSIFFNGLKRQRGKRGCRWSGLPAMGHIFPNTVWG